MLQLRSINRELRKMSEYLELEKGEGYFYFVYDDGGNAYETENEMVASLNHLTMDQWLSSAQSFLTKLEENGVTVRSALSSTICTRLGEAFSKIVHPTAEALAVTTQAVLKVIASDNTFSTRGIKAFRQNNAWCVKWPMGPQGWAKNVVDNLNSAEYEISSSPHDGSLCFDIRDTMREPFGSAEPTGMSPEDALAVFDVFEFFTDGTIRRYPDDKDFEKALKSLRQFVADRRG